MQLPLVGIESFHGEGAFEPPRRHEHIVRLRRRSDGILPLDRFSVLGYFALGIKQPRGGDYTFQKKSDMKRENERDLFPGALEMMILRTLRRQPLHGYALVQSIKRASDDLLEIEEGSLYPALQRLLREELVSSEWGVSATNRRVRIYKLTQKGARHLEREVSSFERMLQGITRVLAPVKS